MTIGLVGAHRVGKTSLAKKYAQDHDFTFAQTSVSAFFRSIGHDPSEAFDFETRLTIQEQLLIHMNLFYRHTQGSRVITDRTPIDLLGYTLAEAVGASVPDHLQKRVARYAEDCFTVTNRWFSAIIVVQPGIPLVHEEGKAPLNQAYIDHLNALMVGLCGDERMKAPHFYVPKNRLDIDGRVVSVSKVYDRICQSAVEQAASTPSNLFH